MAKHSDRLAASLDPKDTGGAPTGLLAEEDVFDRRTLWRLGSWGLASVGAVVVALYANQSSIALRREEAAAADLARQAQQIQSVAKESQNETRRLASAIETLNSDRDRLYSRVTVLEQGLDSVTGAIAGQGTAAASPPAAPPTPSATAEPQAAAQNPAPAPAPVVTTVSKIADKPSVATTPPEQGPATVASVTQKDSAQKDSSRKDPEPPLALPATPLVTSRSMIAPPDAAATKLIEPEKPKPAELEKAAKAIAAAPVPEVVAAAPSAPDATPDAAQAAAASVQRTEFGVDVGGANSVGGLRALWRGLLKSRSNAPLAALRPIIKIKEGSNGLGMQLRLVAGPLDDAAAAAKICAGLTENDRPCETTVFEGQRLAMKADDSPPDAAAKPGSAKPATGRGYWHRRGAPMRVTKDEPVKKTDPPSTFSSFFRR